MNTKERIVESADLLFYQRGFEHTSFADIAADVGISRGNFYHHFPSKDALLDAVLVRRMQSTQSMLEEWERDAATPSLRIQCFIRILIANQSKIMAYGCPVGTLSMELSKLEHPSQEGSAKIFSIFRDWLSRQFSQLGHGPESDFLALHVLARSQGIATLANAFQDSDYVHAEVELLCGWVDSLSSSHR